MYANAQKAVDGLLRAGETVAEFRCVASSSDTNSYFFVIVTLVKQRVKGQRLVHVRIRDGDAVPKAQNAAKLKNRRPFTLTSDYHKNLLAKLHSYGIRCTAPPKPSMSPHNTIRGGRPLPQQRALSKTEDKTFEATPTAGGRPRQQGAPPASLSSIRDRSAARTPTARARPCAPRRHRGVDCPSTSGPSSR